MITAPSYHHAEAFCLMWYHCEKCMHKECIWNSRDGVTPFCLGCPSCGEPSLQHAVYPVDLCVPDYKLNLYQRFWRDGTPEEAIAIVHRRIEAVKGTEYEVSEEQRREMIAAVANGEWHEFQPGWPMIDVCKEA